MGELGTLILMQVYKAGCSNLDKIIFLLKGSLLMLDGWCSISMLFNPPFPILKLTL